MRSVKTIIFMVCAALAFATHAATIAKLSTAGTDEANGASINPAISADGSLVVFESDASNLTADDTNGVTDIFLFDVQNNTIERVSMGLGGAQANGASTNPVISGDGRYIAFESSAFNLVNDDSNQVIDIFLYDRESGSTTRISVNSSGAQASSHSFAPSISDDGRVIAFYSLAANLVAGDSNRAIDVFLHDTLNQSTERVSVAANGNQANTDSWQPSISADGQHIVFASNASNLTAGDTNSAQDIFLYDRQGPVVTLVSNTGAGLPSNGRSSYPAVSGDGNFVVFESEATNLAPNDNNYATDIFVFDRNQPSIIRVNTSESGDDANGPAFQPEISRDGRMVSFFSYASNLVDTDMNQFEDVFIYDRQTGNLELLTNTEAGEAADSSSFNPSLSADGRYVALFSFASNLVTPDTNNFDDVFLFDRGPLNNPPIANAGSDGNIILGETVMLDGTASVDPDGDPISLYDWRVISAPAASQLSNWSSSEAITVFFPDAVGVFVISLTVSDGLAFSTADEVFISVSDNLPPVAVVTADVTQGYAPLAISFNGGASYDPESGPITWAWDFGDGGSSTDTNPVHVYSTPGSFLSVLTVTDNLGNQDQAELRIDVLAVNQPPVIVNLVVSPASGPAPLVTNLSVQAVDPENGSLSIVWDLGDGAVVYDVWQLVHTYNYSGDYKGSVTVSDGVSSTKQKFVVSVESDFSIYDTHYKIQIHNEKPEQGKFRFWTRFVFNDRLADDDIVALEFAGLDIFQLTFKEFRMNKPGLYVYKSNKLMVKLDFNRQEMEVYRQRMYITDENFKPYSGLTLRFGEHVAVADIEVEKHKMCQKNHHDHDEKDCPVTIITDKDSHTH
ncbi:MAG: PKD domain-containing protein [Gammaproteobacteria bacterium]|nr:PKD domain-containing protein [Gammaproteobacteria bacterium]